LSLGRQEAWHGPCLKWHGHATLCHAKPSTSRKMARAMPILARPCAIPGLHFTKIFHLLPSFYHTNISPHPNFSLKPPYPTTFKPSYIPQNSTNSAKFFTKTLPNIIPNITHHSKTTFIHPNLDSPKFEFPKNLTKKPKNVHQSPQPNSKTLLKP